MEETVAKLINGEKLSEEELSDLIEEFEIDRLYGEDRRWSRTNDSIIEIDKVLYAIMWEEGLTEMQENEYYEQPIKVTKTVKTENVVQETTIYSDGDRLNISKSEIIS